MDDREIMTDHLLNVDHLEDEEDIICAEKIILELPPEIRLDIGVSNSLEKSRSFVQGLIRDSRVRVNGKVQKANYKVRERDVIEVEIPAPQSTDIQGEDIPLDIVYEDDDLLVVNKPQGMVVHPAPGAWQGTLVNALLFHCRNLSGINGILRPGIVHRIDKDTSGLLVVAKNDEAHQGLAAQIKAHSMARRYKAIVYGRLEESSGTVDAPIGRDPGERKRMAVTFGNSKPAVTHYTVLCRANEFTYVEAKLETGRTHQIRVHMAYLQHPVLGDPVYGPRHSKFELPGQMLHAAQLGFIHPRTGEQMNFLVDVPPVFAKMLIKLDFKI